MIAYLKGKIKYIKPVAKKDNFFIIDVNGVGYQVSATATVVNKLKVGSEAELFTYLAVREDASELFGFFSPSEVEFFKLLISVSGIGPKKALSILEQAAIADIQKAVISDKPESLVRISGLTKNLSEKIVVGLQDKIQKLTVRDVKGAQETLDDSEVIEALMTLGFSTQQAKGAAAKLSDQIKDKDKRIKEALKILGSNK